jgi:hypothetical protein
MPCGEILFGALKSETVNEHLLSLFPMCFGALAETENAVW